MDLIKANRQITVSPVNEAALEKLPSEYRAIISAALQPKIAELPALDVVTDFATILTTAYTIAGQQPDTKALALYADEFFTKLLVTYPSVTIDEVRAAIRAGVYGEYGEYYGLNPKTFIQFVRSYLYSNERAEAGAEYENNRLTLIFNNKLSLQEKEENNKEFVNILYRDYLAGQLITDYIPTYLYDFLLEQNMIALSIDEKRKINECAKAYYLRMNNSPKLNTGFLSDAITGYLRSTDTELIARIISKQFAVYDYFEKCKIQKKELIFTA